MKNFSQNILDSLSDHIAVINNEGIILTVNKSWENFSKENGGDLYNSGKGANYFNVCQKEVKDGIFLVLQGKQTRYNFEYSCHDNQQLSWFLLRATPIIIDDCGHIGAVISHVNITDRKIAELSLVQKEEQYRLITENSTDFISTHKVNGVYTYASPICKSLLGYHPSELIGKSAYHFFHPEDKKKIRCFGDMSLKQHEIQTITYRFRCKNNAYIWFETKFQRLETSNGEEEIISISRDVTSHKLKLLKLQAEKNLLKQKIHIDELTGVFNRRLFNQLLPAQFKVHHELDSCFSLLMVDIDYFKQYNDTYGHPKGDQCLILVAETLKKHVRESDIVCRIGGEEFCIILPDTNKTSAIKLAKRLSRKVEQLKIIHETSPAHPIITISIGVSSFKKNKCTTIDAQALLNQADQALYQAKGNGRNNVIFYEKQ